VREGARGAGGGLEGEGEFGVAHLLPRLFCWLWFSGSDSEYDESR
jgi:hypothetical protein